MVPVIALIPRPRLVLPLGVFLASAGVSLLLLDTLVFAENRYHLGVLTASLLAPETWAFLALYFLVGLAIEAMLAGWVWKRTAAPAWPRRGRTLVLGLAACFLASHLIHMIAHAYFYVPVTSFTRYLPLYFPFQEPRTLAKLRAPRGQHRLVPARGRLAEGELHYPLAPLRCEPHPPLLNVLLVVIDGMRADALTSMAAPRLTAFASGAVQFDQHFSGGNVSRRPFTPQGWFAATTAAGTAFMGLRAWWSTLCGITKARSCLTLSSTTETGWPIAPCGKTWLPENRSRKTKSAKA